MSNLRSKLIRLAHQNPSLRTHLLPVLKTGGFLGLLGNDNPFGISGDHKRATKEILEQMEKAEGYMKLVRGCWDEITRICARNHGIGITDEEVVDAIYTMWEKRINSKKNW